MKTASLSAVLVFIANAVPSAAAANDFPTSTRVEYVLECMKTHDGKYEYLYKCSCAIDEIAKQVPFEDYVQISTAARFQTLGGERGAEFRDPPSVKAMAGKYKSIEQRAANACFGNN
jgi:hypothetical protein